MIAFGPVPSRRLGRSLGINHLPAKVCTYSCAYCQVGATTRLVAAREPFRTPDALVEAVTARVEAARAAGEWIDYLTFVPDGEPTLDLALGRVIEGLQPLGIPIAVITNGSLLHRDDVREEMAGADLVSIKVDGVDEATWRRINRPHGRLDLPQVLDGMREFAGGFPGRLLVETMLLDGLNDEESLLRDTASFIAELEPAVAYLALPTRPPAEPWVRPAGPEAIARAYEVFRALVGRVQLLVDYEGEAFTATGDPRTDLLGITAVHPMREGAVIRLLARAGADASLLPDLVERGELVEVGYGGHRYYLRPLSRQTRRVRDGRAHGPG